MAEQKTSRTQSSTEAGQGVARREPEMMRRQMAPGWFGGGPFEFMDRIASEMDRTFDRMFGDLGLPRRSWVGRPAERGGVWAPRVEAMQKGDRFLVRADLPGLKKEDVQIDLTDDAITISGQRKEEREEEREGYYHSEREYGQFCRTIPLPEGAITESAEATFKNGVLEISMQAPPEATRGRKLEIKESTEAGEKKQSS